MLLNESVAVMDKRQYLPLNESGPGKVSQDNAKKGSTAATAFENLVDPQSEPPMVASLDTEHTAPQHLKPEEGRLLRSRSELVNNKTAILQRRDDLTQSITSTDFGLASSDEVVNISCSSGVRRTL